jgi:hypothetical protein
MSGDTHVSSRSARLVLKGRLRKELLETVRAVYAAKNGYPSSISALHLGDVMTDCKFTTACRITGVCRGAL